jgi:hypothetical protein
MDNNSDEELQGIEIGVRDLDTNHDGWVEGLYEDQDLATAVRDLFVIPAALLTAIFRIPWEMETQRLGQIVLSQIAFPLIIMLGILEQ